MALAADAGVRINGAPLAGHAHREVHGWTDIEMGHHALVIIEEAAPVESTAIMPVAPLVVAASAPIDHAAPVVTQPATNAG